MTVVWYCHVEYNEHQENEGRHVNFARGPLRSYFEEHLVRKMKFISSVYKCFLGGSAVAQW